MNLQGAHAVVTGASRGIGAATSRELRRRGARVTMVARSEAQLEQLGTQIRAAYHALDLTRSDALEPMFDDIVAQHGPVDLLVNNAALSGVGEFVSLTPQSLIDVIATNLVAPTILTRLALPGMIERQRGTVVCISSVAGEMAMRNAASYGATKAGLTMLAQDLQRELANEPVTVMSVILGEVETPILEEVRADPVMAQVNKRFGVLPSMTPDYVASKLADAVERNRRSLVLPAVLRPIVGLRAAPSRLMDLAMVGIR